VPHRGRLDPKPRDCAGCAGTRPGHERWGLPHHWLKLADMSQIACGAAMGRAAVARQVDDRSAEKRCKHLSSVAFLPPRAHSRSTTRSLDVLVWWEQSKASSATRRNALVSSAAVALERVDIARHVSEARGRRVDQRTTQLEIETFARWSAITKSLAGPACAWLRRLRRGAAFSFSRLWGSAATPRRKTLERALAQLVQMQHRSELPSPSPIAPTPA